MDGIMVKNYGLTCIIVYGDLELPVQAAEGILLAETIILAIKSYANLQLASMADNNGKVVT